LNCLQTCTFVQVMVNRTGAGAALWCQRIHCSCCAVCGSSLTSSAASAPRSTLKCLQCCMWFSDQEGCRRSTACVSENAWQLSSVWVRGGRLQGGQFMPAVCCAGHLSSGVGYKEAKSSADTPGHTAR
jgi:hypothetical protein